MTVRILTGDCRDVLATLPAASVHCVVTSPPYFGLRDYGVSGQIGLEPTPDAYVAALVAVFREVRRVLRDDGTAWLNLGDSYAAERGQRKPTDAAGPKQRTNGASTETPSRDVDGMGGGNLLGIPWRVAFALQASGWTLRDAVVWAKRAPMPESVAGWRFEGDKLRRGSWRHTSSYELVFMLTKGMGYFANQEAVREANADSTIERAAAGYEQKNGVKMAARHVQGLQSDKTTLGAYAEHGSGRNPRNVWHLGPEPFAGAHFAVMPTAIPVRCIRASTADKVCGACGAPWAPVVERERRSLPVRLNPKHADAAVAGVYHAGQDRSGLSSPGWRAADVPNATSTVLAHRPTCACNAAPAPAVVLDPFAGAGTTLLVAARLGRDAIGIELSAEYAGMARARIVGEAPLLAEVEDDPARAGIAEAVREEGER